MKDKILLYVVIIICSGIAGWFLHKPKELVSSETTTTQTSVPQPPVDTNVAAQETVFVPKIEYKPLPYPNATVHLSAGKFDSMRAEIERLRTEKQVLLKPNSMQTYKKEGSVIDVTYYPEKWFRKLGDPFSLRYQPAPKILESVKTVEQYETPPSILSGIFVEGNFTMQTSTKLSVIGGGIGLRLGSENLELDIEPFYYDNRVNGVQVKASGRYFVFR